MRRAILFLMAVSLGAAPSRHLDRRVHRAVKHAPGTVCLFAKNLDTGATYGLRADDRVRAASTIKLPIMVAAFAAVAADRARWDETLLLRDADKISGSGVLHELSGGLRLPLGDLMHLMIVVSDNTATNLLLARLSPDSVNAQMDKLGLPATRCLRQVRGDGPPAGLSRAGLLPENQQFGLGVSTPREMVLLLEKIERGEVVSPEASKEMIAVLKRQQLRDGLARRLGETPVASKSGALDHLRSDVGIIYSPGGRIALAITVDGLPQMEYSPDNPGTLLIWKLGQILVEGLSKP
jgi:beta-lactamase class A